MRIRYLIIVIISSLACTVQPNRSHVTNVYGSNSLYCEFPFGKYKASHWVDKDVAGLTYDEANTFVGKNMVIDSSYFILFDDTLKNTSYLITKTSRDKLLNPRLIDNNRLGLKEDSIMVLTITTPPNDPHGTYDIIITKEYLMTEYLGYFFFFKLNRPLRLEFGSKDTCKYAADDQSK